MEHLYIREKNNINVRLKEIELYKSRNETSLKAIKAKTSLTDFDKARYAKLEKEISLWETERIELEKKFDDLQHRRIEIDIPVLQPQKPGPPARQVYKPKVMERVWSTNYTSEKQMAREEARYLNATLPDRFDLDRLPNNRGYIWNGVWWFGTQPEEKGKPVVMQERVRGSDILRTIESDETGTRVYEKRGKGNRVFVSDTPRSGFYRDFMLKRSFGLL